MSDSLMTSRRFAPLFWCQFFAAFNDNFLRNALVFLALFRATETGGAPAATLSVAILIAPYFFLSGLGGEIADRYDKATVIRRLRLVGIGAALIAALVRGGFRLGLGWRALSAAPPPAPLGVAAFFQSGTGIHAAIGFLGLAIAGGVFIVPAASAVQAWSEPSERARMIGAVN